MKQKEFKSAQILNSTNFFNPLFNLNVMKNRLSVLVLALFATSVAAFGQALPGTKAVPLSCVLNDPLNPVAGRPYDYSAIINPTGGSAYWYATKSTTFTTAGVRVATEIPANGTAIETGATNYQTSAVSPTSPTTTRVTWTSAGLDGVNATTSPLFMVVEYAGPTCANNLKVMQIIPKIAFTVDITNMTHGATPTSLAYGAAESQCYANVASAVFNAGKMDFDYGVNVLYFEVIGANFTGLYKPTLKLSGLQGTQTADIDWGYAVGTYSNNLTTNSAAPSVTTPQFTVTTTDPKTDEGVSIYVRVTIKNHGWEGLGNDNITLAVEAVDGTSAANKDVDPDCTTFTDFGDIAMQTLNARPTITAGTPMVPQNP
jgi:hypothetical protein